MLDVTNSSDRCTILVNGELVGLRTKDQLLIPCESVVLRQNIMSRTQYTCATSYVGTDAEHAYACRWVAGCVPVHLKLVVTFRTSVCECSRWHSLSCGRSCHSCSMLWFSYSPPMGDSHGSILLVLLGI